MNDNIPEIHITEDHIGELNPEIENLQNIDLEIAKTEASIRRDRKRSTIFMSFGAFIAAAGIFVSIFGAFLSPDSKYTSDNKQFLIGFVGVAYGGIIAFTGWFMSRSKQTRAEYEIDYLKSKKRILSGLMDKQPNKELSDKEPYFDSLVRINIDNLSDYYKMVRIHTDNSYQLSYWCGLFGFILIATGIFIGFIPSESARVARYISVASGVLTQILSGTSFYLYNRTVQQLKGYHDSLLDVQNILLSFKMLEDITSEQEKVKIITQLITFLVGGSSRSHSAKCQLST